MNDSLTVRVRSLLADVVGSPVDKLPSSAPLSQLASWESLNLVNLMIALEDEFGVSFTPEQAGEMVSIDAVVRILTSAGVR